MEITKVLPEKCITHIISLTSPRDACRCSVVSNFFQFLADSDAVWKKFLPSNLLEIITSNSGTTTTTTYTSLLTSLSKKELYFHLCHKPIIINDGTLSFALEKHTGKICYMIGARGLSVAWAEVPLFWTWLRNLPGSRFPGAAALNLVWWFDIKGRIEAKILSPEITYGAYFVFKFPNFRIGFNRKVVKLGVQFEGSEVGVARRALLDPPVNMTRLPQQRQDGWMEIEMGEFYFEKEDAKFVFSVLEVDDHNPKHGIIIEGIELRRKHDN